jgi:GSCFA family.
MDLFTKIDIPATDWQIDYNSHVAFFGSCFADNISAQFAARKFKVLVNPFGTVYNPLSIAMQIKAIANKQVFGGPEVFQDMRPDRAGNNAPWHCWDAHGSLSAATREECIAKLNKASTHALDFLQKNDVAFITLGTSFVYFLKDIGAAVSNCHQQNPNLFIRKMISVDHVVAALKSIVQDLQKIKRDMRIVFTVSPLRHLSDGAHANTLSKATLQLAINKIIEEQDFATHTTKPAVEYFPSYEIVMDELRDYRFYDSDMVHLSKTAERYIFERMTETYCDSKTRDNIKQVEKFLKMANHRIQDADSPATAAFLQKLHEEAAKLESQIAGLALNM